MESIISNKVGEENIAKVKEYIADSKTDEGVLSHLKICKLKNKLIQKNQNLLTAKMDEQGNLISSKKGLKEEYHSKYQERLSKEISHPSFEDIFGMKRELWKQRYGILLMKKTKSWEMADIIKAINSLKNNKTRDPFGIFNKTLKDCAEVNDLTLSLVKFVNGIKEEKYIPKTLTYSTVTSICKNKGSRRDLENDRGIFLQTIAKKILEKLLYNDLYDDIEEGMSDSNIGARKEQNVRNHIFVVNGIINEVIRKKKESVQKHIYDLVKAFDKINLQFSMNDLYDTIDEGKRNKKLVVLYESNKSSNITVKIPVGNTQNFLANNLVQQGGTWGPIKCSNHIDIICKKCEKVKEMGYRYKDQIRIPRSFDCFYLWDTFNFT